MLREYCLPHQGSGLVPVSDLSPLPVAGAAADPWSFISTAAVQASLIKSGPGVVTGLQFFNVGAAAVYVRLYDTASAPAAASTHLIRWRGVVPGATTGAGFVVALPAPVKFTAGIGIRVTAAIADNDNTALSANEVVGNVQYR